MKQNILLGFVFFLLSVCILWQCNSKSNPTGVSRPLVVYAGPDITVKLNEDVNLAGSATEDGLLDTVFIYSWKQVSGPDSAQIIFPSSQYTKIQFRQTGEYKISLTVSDRVISKSDTVVYTVIDSISFAVLRPAAGDRVVIGDSMLVTWQIVTPLPQTMIDLSIDHGKTWIVLSFPSLINKTQWVWHVDPSLLPNDSCLVKVRDYQNSSHFAISGYFSLVSPAMPVLNPDTTRNPVPQLNYDYYLGAWTALPVFNPDSSIVSQNVDSFDISSTFAPTNFGFDFSGYINVPADGLYTFYCNSADGSKLFIGGSDSCIVSNDGVKAAPQEASGSVDLKKGYHIIRVVYFCASGLPVLTVSWQGPGIPKQTIGASVLFHELTPYIFQLLLPHGPHIYTLGDTVPISWYYKNSPTEAHYTEFNLSLDGGKSFPIPLFTHTISTQPNDTGTVLWTIPNDTTYCTVHGLIQAIEYDRPQVNASTDTEFTIKK
jgi:hypothetical protein